MKRLFPVAVLLLIFTGCSSLPEDDKTNPGRPAATLQEHVPAPTASTASNEIRCHIQMIDGVEAGGSDSLQPGHHRVIVALGSNEQEHVGDVDLLIPAAKNYRLKAERDDESFTISLIESDTGKVAATSTALVNQVMKFKVFVGQK